MSRSTTTARSAVLLTVGALILSACAGAESAPSVDAAGTSASRSAGGAGAPAPSTPLGGAGSTVEPDAATSPTDTASASPSKAPATASSPAPSKTPTTTGAQLTAPSGTGTIRRVSTSAQLSAAISAAQPGDVIRVAAGTYSGRLSVMTSGTKAAPITIEPDGAVKVTLTASLPMPSCGATGPDENRTVTFLRGASWWTLKGVSIDGGVMVSARNANLASKWFSGRVAAGDWTSRRAIPGRGTNDPIAAKNALARLSQIVGATIVPSDGITLDAVTLTRKGLHVRASRYGLVRGSRIFDVACGTGPGIWLGNYSDGWTITGNQIGRIASSSYKHYMQEGIRIGGASSYAVVTGNTVTDLPGDGRAFTTDVDSSYNVFSHNTAQNVAIGFNEQMSGWGNVWEYNTVSTYRTAGFSVRMMDNVLKSPSKNSSSYGLLMRCNVASGGKDFQAGGMATGKLTSNSFGEIQLGSNLRAYFVSAGNTYNGAAVVPPTNPTPSLSGC